MTSIAIGSLAGRLGTFEGQVNLYACHRKTDMPVLAKSLGIVIRMVVDRTFGTHFHAFYGDSELVIGLDPLRVIQGDAPPWVREWALDWVRRNQRELLSAWNLDLNLAEPFARQAAGHLEIRRYSVPSQL